MFQLKIVQWLCTHHHTCMPSRVHILNHFLRWPGRSIDETFRQLEAAQFAAANKGKGCPANWKKGDDTIKADRAGSLEFFKSWGK